MATEGTTTQPVTAEDLCRLSPRGGRYRLIKGELRTMPPAGGEHGSIAMHLTAYADLKRGQDGPGHNVAAAAPSVQEIQSPRRMNRYRPYLHSGRTRPTVGAHPTSRNNLLCWHLPRQLVYDDEG
jgi:hypothetical protein